MSEQNGVAFDLSSAMPTDTAEQHILVPGTNKRTGWVVTHAGPGHPKTVDVNNEALRKFSQREMEKEKARTNGRKWKGDERPPEEQRREFVEGIVARIVTWSPIKIGAETYDFSDKGAVELLLRPEMASFTAQMREFQEDEQSFTKGSATA